jgi:hypothetical protein
VCPGNWSLPVLSLPTPGTQGTTGGGTAPVLSLPLLEDALFQAPPQGELFPVGGLKTVCWSGSCLVLQFANKQVAGEVR